MAENRHHQRRFPNLKYTHNAGIDLKELGGQMLKILKFCAEIEIKTDFTQKSQK